MSACKVRLTAHLSLCSGTDAFYFEKPDGFQFEPGQFADFTLLDPPDTDLEGNSRTLSIASAPHESHLMVAMRLRSTAFKRNLKALPIGSPMLLQGPYGGFTLPRNGSRPAVFLAGGIGITPFRSIVRNAAESEFPRRILLFYSVRVPQEAAFLEELQEMENRGGNYKLIGTITRPGRATIHWRGETGRISSQMLSRWIPDLSVPIYYIAGPSGMVAAVRRTLLDSGIDEESIRTEEFAGYE